MEQRLADKWSLVILMILVSIGLFVSVNDPWAGLTSECQEKIKNFDEGKLGEFVARIDSVKTKCTGYNLISFCHLLLNVSGKTTISNATILQSFESTPESCESRMGNRTKYDECLEDRLNSKFMLNFTIGESSVGKYLRAKRNVENSELIFDPKLGLNEIAFEPIKVIDCKK